MAKTTYNMHDAKTHLSRLAERAAAGEEIVIARSGRPLAKLVPLGDSAQPRRLGAVRGRVRAADDFDAPLPADLTARFEGGSA